MNTSDRPAKKIRLSTSAAYDNVPDIEKVRQKNDLRLQGRFQAIFDKYDRDFTGIGDEIDIVTGKIVVDNGHLSGMRNERDTGRSIRRDPSSTHTQIHVQNDHDELSSSAEQSASKQEHHKSMDRNMLNTCISSALDASQLPFNPYDPVSVAELGKSIALHITKLMQQKSPPNQIPIGYGNRGPNHGRQTMTPPISETDFTSPRATELQSKGLNNTGRPLPDQFASIWAGPEGHTSVSPETDVFAERYATSNRVKPSVPTTDHYDSSQLPSRPLRGRPQNALTWSKEDDDKLRRLKETDQLSWIKIVSAFPGRTVSAIQWRYKKLAENKVETIKTNTFPVYSKPQSPATVIVVRRSKSRDGILKGDHPLKAIAGSSVIPPTKMSSKRILAELQNGSAASTTSTSNHHIPTSAIKQRFLHVLVPSKAVQHVKKSTTIKPLKQGEFLKAKTAPSLSAQKHNLKPVENAKTPPKMVEDLGSDDELG